MAQRLRQFDQPHPTREARTGEGGRMHFGPPGGPPMDSTPPSVPAPSGCPGLGIEGSLADFVQALQTGGAPMGEVHDNLLSLAMVHAAIASADRGHRVVVDELLAAAGS